MNIQFNYLYRDAGNFKLFGNVVLANPEDLATDDLEGQIRRALIDETFFVAKQVHLPSLRFADFLPNLDHDWHEFESLIETDREATDSRRRTAKALAEALSNAVVSHD